MWTHGTRRRLIVPPNLAHESTAPPDGPIPSNSWLVFELLDLRDCTVSTCTIWSAGVPGASAAFAVHICPWRAIRQSCLSALV